MTKKEFIQQYMLNSVERIGRSLKRVRPEALRYILKEAEASWDAIGDEDYIEPKAPTYTDKELLAVCIDRIEVAETMFYDNSRGPSLAAAHMFYLKPFIKEQLGWKD